MHFVPSYPAVKYTSLYASNSQILRLYNGLAEPQKHHPQNTMLCLGTLVSLWRRSLLSLGPHLFAILGQGGNQISPKLSLIGMYMCAEDLTAALALVTRIGVHGLPHIIVIFGSAGLVVCLQLENAATEGVVIVLELNNCILLL